jgi:predicted enzyme related to lactoylglutathione lyase
MVRGVRGRIPLPGLEGALKMKDAVNWFELPVVDLARAQKFYETVLGQKLKNEVFGGLPMAMFPGGKGVQGALVKDERRKPAADGALVYFNATGALDGCLQRIPEAGGRILLPKSAIGEQGFIALVLDTEGNQIGLHAEPT